MSTRCPTPWSRAVRLVTGESADTSSIKLSKVVPLDLLT
jgi:hypothetical protein